MLSRSKIYHKVDATREAKKVFIFCEGDKEVNYFTFFKGFSSNIDIIPIPNNNGKSDPEKLNEDANLKLKGNEFEKPKFRFEKELGDEVWFVIDTDRWNEANKIQNLKDSCANEFNWFVTQSNPCFEIWLYYHVYSYRPDENEVKTFASFKDYVDKKISGGFDHRKHPQIFQDAIKNSEANFELENDQPKYLATEVFQLGKSILPFIKDIIDTCLRDQVIKI